MMIRTDSAAKYLCERSGWSLSNLPLQKLLYLAEVERAASAQDYAPLMDKGFQAWDYGPVIPSLYGRLKMFGADPVGDVFYDALNLKDGSPSKEILDRVLDQFGCVPPGELIELTHWRYGAWAKNYEPGIRNTPISYKHIAGEAANRIKFADEWRAITGT